MRRRGAVVAGVVAVGTAAVAAVAFTRPAHQPRRPTVSVQVSNRRIDVAPGTTLADAERDFRLQPRAGRLLDVNGRVLRPDVFAGRVLLDGRATPGSTTLRPGDRITVVDGLDRSEALERTIVHVRGGLEGDPQYTSRAHLAKS